MKFNMYDRAVSQLLGNPHNNNGTLSCEFRIDPQFFLDQVQSFDAAISRTITGHSPLSEDDAVITERVGSLTNHILEQGEPNNDSF